MEFLVEYNSCFSPKSSIGTAEILFDFKPERSVYDGKNRVIKLLVLHCFASII